MIRTYCNLDPHWWIPTYPSNKTHRNIPTVPPKNQTQYSYYPTEATPYNNRYYHVIINPYIPSIFSPTSKITSNETPPNQAINQIIVLTEPNTTPSNSLNMQPSKVNPPQISTNNSNRIQKQIPSSRSYPTIKKYYHIPAVHHRRRITKINKKVR